MLIHYNRISLLLMNLVLGMLGWVACLNVISPKPKAGRTSDCGLRKVRESEDDL